MRRSRRVVAGFVLLLALTLSLSPRLLSQTVPGWVLNSAPNSLELTNVAPHSADGNALKFTLKNISSKTIIELRVGAGPSSARGLGSVTGRDAFTTGVGGIEPGATIDLIFDSRDFVVQGQNEQVLRVQAIVYADGSRWGTPKFLRLIAGEMLGAALQTKRDLDALASISDAGMPGINEAIARLGGTMPSSEQIADSLRGTVLSGISQQCIDKTLSRSAFDLRSGANVARETMLLDLKNTKSNIESGMSGTSDQRRRAEQRQSTAFSDFVARFRSLSEKQTKLLQAFLAHSDQN